MADPTSDPDRIKARTQAEWSATAEGWHESIRTLAQYLDPPTEIMLDLAGAQAGDRVLDLAAGAGGQAILAARRVGPTGFVLATDISRQMLDFAEAEIERAGLTNVETRVMDGENLQLPEESFDSVICRGGLEFFPRPKEALAGMRRVVKTGKKVAVIVFSDPDKCPHVAIPGSIISARTQQPAPPPGAPGVFSLARPGLLQALYETGGFRDVQVVPVTAHLRLSSAAECVRFLQNVGAPVQQMLAEVSEAQRRAAWEEVEQALRRYEGPSGFAAPCEFLVGVGTK